MRIRFTIVLLLLAANSAMAQIIKYRVRHISVAEGLSHSDATAIIQDKKGFIWIGTFSGLNRYDGQNVKQYRNRNTRLKSVYHNRINSISLDSGNNLWLGTGQGIVVFNPANENFTDLDIEFLPKTSTNNNFSQVIWLSDSLVVATTDHFSKLSAYKKVAPNKLKEIPFGERFPGNNLYTSIVSDGKNQLLIGSDTGLFVVSYDTPRNTTTGIEKIYLLDKAGVIHTGISSVLYEGAGKFIAATNNGFCSFTLKPAIVRNNVTGVRFVNVAKAMQFSLPGAKKQANILFVLPDIVPDCYWGVTSDGIFKYQPKIAFNGVRNSVQFIKEGNDLNYDLSSDFINKLFIDRSGCLWVLTYGGGVNLINLNQKKFYLLSKEATDPSKTLSGNHIRAMLEDDDGALWIGTRFQGLNKYDFKKGTNTVYRHNPDNPGSLMSDNVRALAKDKKNRIWIGTDFGIDIFNGKQFNHIDGKLLSGNAIYSIAVDVFGQVWAGSWDKGLNRITEKEDGSFVVQKIYEDSKGISGEQVTFVFADKERPEIFVATTNGLDRIMLNNQGSIARIIRYQGKEKDERTLTSNFIWPIIRTDANTLWAGTLGGGLNKITLDRDGYHSKAYGPSNGLPFEDVETLLEDNEGNLWMGGGNGLVMFDIKKERFTQYDINDGLQSNSFKIGAACRGKDGKVFFGGTNGVNYFFPQEINQLHSLQPLVFTDLIMNDITVQAGKGNILNETVNDAKRICLAYGQNYFSIRFATLDFANPGKWKYRYMLEGFDNNWIETDASHASASYANLPPGNYYLNVQSSQDKENWTNHSRLLPVIITPPWWKTGLAKIIYGSLLFFILYLIYKYALRMVRLRRALHFKEQEEKHKDELHRMRLQFFTNISHELRTPLSLILTPVEKLIEDAEVSDKRTNLYLLIQKNANRLLKLVNELMDFRKAEEGSVKLCASEIELISFTNSIAQDFSEVASEKGVKLHINKNAEPFKAWVDPSILEKIIVNILANAVKYTPSGGEISVHIYTNQLPTSDLSNSFKIKGKVSEKDLYWIKVADTGSGVDAYSLPRIFERFFQAAEHENTDRILSTGIGLALVKSLTLAHRGSIYIFSQRFKGTEFFIGLPKGYDFLSADELLLCNDYQLTDESIIGLEEKYRIVKATDEELLITPPINHNPKLLLIEDNADLRNFLAQNLSAFYNVITAVNGRIGFDRALEELPDIIVSDIMMPEMDGIELCNKIKNTFEISHIPVILLTAKTSVENSITGVESGADLYLSKPFSLRLLKTNIQNLLQSRKKLKVLYLNNGLHEARELSGNAKDKGFIDELTTFIKSNMDEPEFDVEKICRAMAISKSKLYIKMHQVTGLTIGDFVRKIKLNHAAYLLVTQNSTVSQVLVETGFQSASHFTKAFKKEFGKTPTQYVYDFGKTHNR